MQQQALMSFDPATGEPKPYPSHAKQWREWHGFGMAWLFNPWTGGRRSAGDVGTDVMGHLIQPPTEPLYAAQGDSNACMAQQAQGGMVLGGAISGLGQMLAEQRRSRITPAPHA
ncbi:MAG: hypothetical protein Q8N17_26180 [Burkholderiaceae bacterium]|nr:hypothetical protein [Burkholderiaceae bacterium]